MNTTTSQKIADFEKMIIGIISILCGGILIYLTIYGPFFLNAIHYKTSLSGISQIKGQDLVNLFLMAPLLITGGVTHILNKDFSRYLVILTPVYLIYYGLSMGIGMEWGFANYSGNSEKLTFHFLFLIISGLLILLYSNTLFTQDVSITFKKKPMIIYSAIFVIFLLLFSMMWLKEVVMVINNTISVSYEQSPVLFWVIRYFDLGLSIPLGLLSVYLLWTRPNSAISVQLLFYGFFITTITAVCSMGFLMYLDHAPDFSISVLAVFMVLALIVYAGFIFIMSAITKPKPS
ncbi:MAG: hypothetical protein HOO86_13825 [Bacteroidales bacterium]|nr:hypothetical protein [Bacteroidales bacterium]